MEKLFGFIIKVYAGEYPNSGILEVHRWEGYKFSQFIKWKWYFEYRVALLRVKYPKNHIDARQFDEPLTPKAEAEILKSKISAQKGQVTKIKNAIERAERNWDQLFPIEDDQYYQKAQEKLYKAEIELKELMLKFNK